MQDERYKISNNSSQYNEIHVSIKRSKLHDLSRAEENVFAYLHALIDLTNRPTLVVVAIRNHMHCRGKIYHKGLPPREEYDLFVKQYVRIKSLHIKQ